MADAQPSAVVAAAKTLGIVLSSTTSGMMLGISAVQLPRLLELPVPLMLRQWARTYHAGVRTFPPLATLSAAPYLFLAARLWRSGRTVALLGGRYSVGAAQLYLFAAALAAGVIPYTFAFVVPTNKKLFRKVDESSAAADQLEGKGVAAAAGQAAPGEVSFVELGPREESAKYLVDHWGVLNLGRVLLLGAAGVVGIVASL